MSGATGPLSLSTAETVALDTEAAWATSAMVGRVRGMVDGCFGRDGRRGTGTRRDMRANVRARTGTVNVCRSGSAPSTPTRKPRASAPRARGGGDRA
ncbi:hypothetical protein tb265_21200 [Gemmatimonadetes bacterium T265]|nr:hypothetical protein tb265_21200 [Gemmatimonadetes bacterium T265]